MMKTSKLMQHSALAAVLLATALGLGAAEAARANGKSSVGYPALKPLPPVSVPVDNPQTPEKIALGKQLFWDGRLSGDGSMPCVSCHLPGLGWGDGGQISRGYPGTRHWRNSQTILNSAYYNKLFWEGSSTSLEAQAQAAAEGSIAGNGDSATMEMRLRFLPEYVESFRKVFGSEWPRINDAWRAIAAYQRTVISDASNVPFDRYAKGDKKALNEAQKRGLALFNGKAGCIQCHNGALATDQKYYNLGLPDFEGFKGDTLYQVTHRWQQYQKGVAEPKYRGADMDYGLYFQTNNPKDIGKFRTPSLREVKYTGPYMHNGVFTTLEQVVDFYNAGGGQAPNKSDKLKPLGLTAQDKADLLAFLDALSMSVPLIHDDPKLPGDFQPLPAPVK